MCRIVVFLRRVVSHIDMVASVKGRDLLDVFIEICFVTSLSFTVASVDLARRILTLARRGSVSPET